MVIRDTTQLEYEQISSMVELEGRKILDIGCGDGRLTFQIASKAKQVIGIDVDEDLLEIANTQKEKNNVTNVEFKYLSGTDIDFESQSFDIVIFSLSLCCIESLKAKRKTLKKVHHILKSEGLVINIMPSIQVHFKGAYQWYLLDKEYDTLTVWHEPKEARGVLKRSVYSDRIFEFIEEKNFTTTWHLNDKEEAFEYWIEEHFGDISKFSKKDIAKVKSYIASLETENGINYPVNETISLLRKI